MGLASLFIWISIYDSHKDTMPNPEMREVSDVRSKKDNSLQNEGEEDVAEHSGQVRENDRSGREYMCDICYLHLEDPVLTQCGHLFCWKCIYIWSQSIGGCKSCPTCRNEMGIDEVIPILAACSREGSSSCPPRPGNNKKIVRVIVPGMKINGTRFGNIILQDDGMDLFSCRTVLGLFIFVCAVVAMTLKSYFFGE